MIIDGAGGYYDPADRAGPGRVHRHADARGHRRRRRRSRSPSSSIGSRRRVGVGAGHLVAVRHGDRQRPDQQPGHRARADGRRADAPVVPAGGDRSLQDADAGRPDATSARSRASSRRSASTRRCSAIIPPARVSPTPEALDALTRDALVEFHKAHYVPDRAVLAVAGDITLAQAKAKAEAAFGAWKKTGATIAAPVRRAADRRAVDLAGRAARLGADEPASSARRASSAPIRTTRR